MEAITFNLKDVIWLIILAVGIAGNWFRSASEIRHLKDIKADKAELTKATELHQATLQSSMDKLYTKINEIGTSLTEVRTRLESLFEERRAQPRNGR